MLDIFKVDRKSWSKKDENYLVECWKQKIKRNRAKERK